MNAIHTLFQYESRKWRHKDMSKKKTGPAPKVILWVAFCLSLLVAVTIIIPGLLVKKIPSPIASPKPTIETLSVKAEQTLMIPVYLSKKATIETVSLEAYVRGVVAAEMPIEFGLEALKAQAMAARTYMIRRIAEQDFSKVPTRDAWITDTIAHQAYISEEDLQHKWQGQTLTDNLSKINQAVKETQDLILTYAQKPINATFFSTSNGYTENSEDYWDVKVPYLVSVPSPWDATLSPRYQETVSISYKTVLQKLGLSNISAASGKTAMKVLETTAGHRIKRMTIGGKIVSGREVREKLGLASSQFDWKWKGDQIEFTTYGSGHGVGLSQWGAEGMAREGKTAEDIVKYYYRGISIARASDILTIQ
jgi:stage II sporulation protein D